MAQHSAQFYPHIVGIQVGFTSILKWTRENEHRFKATHRRELAG